MYIYNIYWTNQFSNCLYNLFVQPDWYCYLCTIPFYFCICATQIKYVWGEGTQWFVHVCITTKQRNLKSCIINHTVIICTTRVVTFFTTNSYRMHGELVCRMYSHAFPWFVLTSRPALISRSGQFRHNFYSSWLSITYNSHVVSTLWTNGWNT